MNRDGGADESTWQECFAAARNQVPSQWSDFAVESLTVLVMAGTTAEGETNGMAADALAWFLRHRADVLNEAMRWAGMEMVSFAPAAGFGRYSNERALVTLRQLRIRLGG